MCHPPAAATSRSGPARSEPRPATRVDPYGRALRTLRAAVLLVVAGFAPASSQEVTDVEFRGRAAIDADVLDDAISTRASSCRSALAAPLCLLGIDRFRVVRTVDSAEVVRDERRIAVAYELQGYPGTTVRSSLERDGAAVRVVFMIDEAPPIVVRTMRSHGLPRGVPDPDLLPLGVGDPYGLPALEATLDRIAFHLARHGHPYASVEVAGSIDEPDRAADIELEIRPGPLARFGRVTVVGLEPLNAGALGDRVLLREGDRYDPLALEDAERRLYQLESTGVVDIRIDGLGDSATVLPVHVEVSPRRLRGLEAEGTLSTTDCVEAAAFWTHRHLGGRPRVLRIGAAVSGLLAEPLDGAFPCTDAGTGVYGRPDYRAQVTVEEPIPGTAASWVRAELFGERASTPDLYIERSVGLALGARSSPGEDYGVYAEYRPRRVELESVELYVCGNYGACEADAPEILGGPAWLAPITVGALWMSDRELQGVTREKLAAWRLEPLPRFRAEARVAAEAAGPWTLSDYAYARVLGQASATRRFAGVWEIAGRVRAGGLLGDDVLPPSVRLLSGGPNSVRGVQQNLLGPAVLLADPRDLDRIGCAPAPDGCPSDAAVDPELVRLRPLGGTHLVESGVEARWSFAPRAQAAAFVDFGAVAGDETSEWMVAPGIGIRLVANIGAIRIDLAFDPRGPRSLPLRSAATPDGEILDLGTVRYDPYAYDDPGFLREVWRRLQLHFAVGQAF